MRIQLFGSISATDADDQEVPLGGPKQRTVLALLCVEPGRPVSTDRLMEAVWGDAVPERASRSLSTYLSSLRRGMGDAIESTGGLHTLHLDRPQIDVCAFSDAMNTADTVSEFQEALTLWGGTPFEGLDGFGAFRDEIQHLEVLRLVAERAVIEADLASGNAVAVVPRIDALVQEFPFDEEIRGLHMRALYGNGRQVEALESFNSFKSQLANELGLDPSPQLQDLELQILQQDETLDGGRQEVKVVSHEQRSRVPFPGFLTRGHSYELIGREEGLRQLDMAYASASDEPRLIAVIGEPGIGKTKLTSTWAAHNVDHGAMIVAGRCTPDAALPYQPFIEIAKTILTAQPDRIRDVGSAAGNLALLVPGAGDSEELPAPIQADPDTVEYLMAEALAALLEPSPGDPATVAILEDLHWADPQSIAVLAYLARRTDNRPLLIIANYRDTDLLSNHPLPGLLTDLRRERRIDRILLDRLNNDEASQMISAHFDFSTSGAVAASIAEETRGNPFFIEELTRHLQDEHAIDNDGQWASDIPIEQFGIPEGLRDVVGRRVKRLGSDATDLLEVAAVIGPGFSIDMAGTIAGLDEDQIDAVADIALGASIINEDTTTGEFVFAHALVRQTIYEGLSARRRVRLHRAVGEEIELSNGEPAAALHHWLAANQPDRALAATVRSSELRRSLSDQAEALREVKLALDLWDDVDDAEKVAGLNHSRLVIRMAAYYADAPPEDPEQGVKLVRRELETAVGMDDATLGRLHSELATLLLYRGRHADAMHHSLLAVGLVPEHPPSTDRATALGEYAHLLTLEGRNQEAIEVGMAATEMARNVRSEYAESKALVATATALGLLGETQQSDELFDDLRSLARRTGRVRDHLAVFINQGEIRRLAGDLEGALRQSDEGAAIAAELRLASWEAFLGSNGAMQAFELGRWREAADRINALPRREDGGNSEMNRMLTRAVIGAERGANDGLHIERQSLSDDILSMLQPQFSGQGWSAFISDQRWRGDLANGYERSSKAFEIHGRLDNWTSTTWLAAYSIELIADAMVADVGDAAWLDLAQRWHDRFLEENPTTRETESLQATSAADLTRAKGEDSPALWRVAIEAWDDGSYGEAKARWRLAEALIEAHPDNPDIESNLDLAQDVAQGLGAQPLLSAIEATRDSIATK